MVDIKSERDSTRTMLDTSDTSLANFFSRPIKIREEEWSTSTSLNFDIDPWTLYFGNPRVSNRMTNYNLCKANLHVKVVINGNGFQYGRMMVSYLPLADYDNMSTMAALIPQDLIQASQCPHIFLDPTTSLGGELKLPYFDFQDSIKIPDGGWLQLGHLYFRTLNNLKHANGATDVVTITVFAWAEDVSMSVLTSIDAASISPQSSEIDEANSKGFISGPATTVSRYASMLSGVPYIAPYAKATEIGASAVSSMAKVFGYSRPSVTSSPTSNLIAQVGSMALTTVPDTCQKLTVDDKQELSIDPRIAGLAPVDCLNIKEIAKRESYLTSFNWNIGTAPDTLLWNSRVSPVTWAEVTGPPKSYHFPACAFAALPFQFWRGTMRFRFQIVCSSFHKGRLKVVYDPNYIANSTYLGYSEYNTNYLKVVDIASEQDFTIDVGWGQNVAYRMHERPGIDAVTQMYSTTRYAVSNSTSNGVLGIIVVNELTTPNSTVNNDIQVNVFVSMGDDFEVAVPDDHFTKFVFKPQSTDYDIVPQSALAPDSQDTVEPSAPAQEQCTIVGMGPSYDSHLNDVYFGETISSFRPLLKRYSLWNVIPKAFEPPKICSARFPQYPYLRGKVTGAVDLTSALVPYNFCNTLLLHWVSAGFSGRRGSVRYKLIPRGFQDRGDRIEVQRARYTVGDTAYSMVYSDLPQYSSVNLARVNAITQYPTGDLPISRTPLSGILGEAITTNSANGALEFEVPYYSNTRFTPARQVDYTTGQTFDSCWDCRIYWPSNSTISDSSLVDIYVASGEDMQFYFFVGMPRMYYEASPPAAT